MFAVIINHDFSRLEESTSRLRRSDDRTWPGICMRGVKTEAGGVTEPEGTRFTLGFLAGVERMSDRSPRSLNAFNDPECMRDFAMSVTGGPARRT